VGEYVADSPPRGRKGLLAQTTDALLRGEKLVVLTGQGGIGKSVLAAVAARRISWRYPGGVFWRSAADIENLDLNKFLDAFDNIFGYEFRTLPLDAKQIKVLSYLQDLRTPSLLVFDNAEIIKDPAIWRFLEGLPSPSAALVTTREAPKREGRQIVIHQMEPVEAARLLIQEARRRSPRFGEKLEKQELEALDKIVHLLDGHPLGIKLAAGLVSSTSLEGIRQNLEAAPSKKYLTALTSPTIPSIKARRCCFKGWLLLADLLQNGPSRRSQKGGFSKMTRQSRSHRGRGISASWFKSLL
jgi:predicted ATPase